MRDHFTIILKDKIYSQRTPNSKIIEFDLNGVKQKSYDELPSEIKRDIALYQKSLEDPKDFFEYEKTKNGIKILRIKEQYAKYIKIPDYIEGLPVVEIGSDVTKGLLTVTQIELPETLQLLNPNSFMSITTLKHINIPENITEIPNGCFFNCLNLLSINLEHVITIEDSAFQNCEALSNINLKSIEYIGELGFCDCVNLKSVKLSSKIRTLEKAVFSGCGIEEITLPNSIQDIAGRAFERCYDLEKINFSENIVWIGEKAFGYCESLKVVNAPSRLNEIFDQAFLNSGVEIINLNKNLKYIGKHAFGNCHKIKQINIYPETEYDTSAFPFAKLDLINQLKEDDIQKQLLR